MDILHKILLGGEIYLASASALVVASLIGRLIYLVLGKSNEFPQNAANIARAMEKSNHESRVHRWLVAFDIFLNVTFMNGQNDETMSAHCWRASLEGKLWGKAMNWWLNGFQPNHGYQAACGDLQRALNRAECEKAALGLK